MNRRILLLSLGLIVLVFSSFNHEEEKINAFDIIVIDAGHGGHDPGCNGGSSRRKKSLYQLH